MSTTEAPVKATPAPRKTKGTGTVAKSATAPAKVKAPKVYVFGGSTEKPELGANSRRLWLWVTENLSQKQISSLRKEFMAIHVAETKAQPDRFLRWQRIVKAAEKLGFKGKGDVAINQALVRRLQAEDKDGKIGRDSSIHFA